MQSTPNAKAKVLLESLRGRTLAPGALTHHEHSRAARSYLEQWPLPGATGRFEKDPKAFVTLHGAQDKHHKTLTWSLMNVINHYRDEGEAQADWHAFKSRAQPFFDHALSALEKHFSTQCLFSAKAKREWVPPDRQPLPCAEPVA